MKSEAYTHLQGTYPPQGGTKQSTPQGSTVKSSGLPSCLPGLAENIQLVKRVAIILVSMFNAKSEVNSLLTVQTQGLTCVR